MKAPGLTRRAASSRVWNLIFSKDVKSLTDFPKGLLQSCIIRGVRFGYGSQGTDHLWFVVSEHIVPVNDFGENLPLILCFEFGRGQPVIFTRNVYKLCGIVYDFEPIFDPVQNEFLVPIIFKHFFPLMVMVLDRSWRPKLTDPILGGDHCLGSAQFPWLCCLTGWLPPQPGAKQVCLCIHLEPYAHLPVCRTRRRPALVSLWGLALGVFNPQVHNNAMVGFCCPGACRKSLGPAKMGRTVGPTPRHKPGSSLKPYTSTPGMPSLHWGRLVPSSQWVRLGSCYWRMPTARALHCPERPFWWHWF